MVYSLCSGSFFIFNVKPLKTLVDPSCYKAWDDVPDQKSWFGLFSYCLQVHLLLELYRLQGNMTRVKINELKPLKPRFEVPDVLITEPPTEPWVCLWSKSAQWNSENSQTHAWFIVFLWVTSPCLRFLPFPLIPLFTPFFHSLYVFFQSLIFV